MGRITVAFCVLGQRVRKQANWNSKKSNGIGQDSHLTLLITLYSFYHILL